MNDFTVKMFRKKIKLDLEKFRLILTNTRKIIFSPRRPTLKHCPINWPVVLSKYFHVLQPFLNVRKKSTKNNFYYNFHFDLYLNFEQLLEKPEKKNKMKDL